MSVSIPSINVPFTDKSGRIHPIWYEFLRKFVADTGVAPGSVAPSAVEIIAGNGLTGGGTLSSNVTIAIGAGNGLTANANDVSIDINGQTSILASLDDEVLLNDVSDNNSLRKTSIRNIMELSAPGGLDTYVQYNDNGIFGGDSGFTYDGAGGITLSSISSSDDLTLTPGGTGNVNLAGTNQAISNSTGTANTRCLSFASNSATIYGISSTQFISTGATGWTIQPASSKTFSVTTDSASMSGIPFCRTYTATQTASTTQTQGQGALTTEYNLITTVANANDTVTLPSMVAAQYCVVCNAGANILQVFPASGDDLGNGTNVATYISPGSFMSWVAFDTFTWRPTGGRMLNSVRANIAASTTQTQGQQPLTEDVNEISTVANANDTVTLPSAPTYSRTIKIINNGANTLQIFPASGDNLGAGVDASTTLASGANVSYTNYNNTNWEAI